MSINAQISDYVAQPTDEHLTALRTAIRSAPNFDVNANPVGDTQQWRSTQDHQRIVDHLTSRMPGLLLNPQAHGMLATALRNLGEGKRGDGQVKLAQIALRSILDSGDGSRERPWQVLRVADEYGVLLSMDRVSARQASLGGGVDEHTCDDGSVVYFHIVGGL